MGQYQVGSMTNFEEILSAALDGECSPAELDLLLAECGRFPELMRRFGRHCASREAVVGTRFNFDSEALCAGVMSHLVPQRHLRVVTLKARAGALVRPLAGLALAASLGAVVTFGVYRFDAPSHGVSASAISPIPSTTPRVMASAGGGGGVGPSSTPNSEVRWTKLAPSAARQLDYYMMEDAGYRSVQGMSSALSYARVASQDNAFGSLPTVRSTGSH